MVRPMFAKTHYVAASGGSDSNPGTLSKPWATFAHALAAMSGCDTLIVENGYYYDHLNVNTSNLNGNVGGSGCYTLIEAATPCNVTVDSSEVSPEPNGTIFFYGASYIQVIGIKAASNPNWKTASEPWFVDNSNHIKLQQTAGYNAPCRDNTAVYTIGPGSSYVLVEDSHAWGCGRYKFISY
jgi:hypothetical protein